MSYLINNQQKMNDIIFAKRNKSYGAYALRSSYGATLFKSLCLIFFGFGTIMYTAYFFSKHPQTPSECLTAQLKPHDSIYVLPVDLGKQFEDPKPAREAPKAKTTSADVPPVVADSVPVVTSTFTNENMITSTGNGTTTVINPDAGNGGKGNGNAVNSGTTAVVETIHVIADKEPEFEGGLRALYAFLGSKLKYPEKASDYGKQGTVYVKFVVDQKGKVGSLTLQNSLGYGLDEEALRVVAMIPDFKNPGMVNGKAVKVYYQLPIKFTLQH